MKRTYLTVQIPADMKKALWAAATLRPDDSVSNIVRRAIRSELMKLNLKLKGGQNE